MFSDEFQSLVERVPGLLPAINSATQHGCIDKTVAQIFFRQTGGTGLSGSGTVKNNLLHRG